MLKWNSLNARLRAHRVSIAIGAMFVLSVLALAFSQSFQRCIDANAYDYNGHALQKDFWHIIGMWVWCGSGALNDYAAVLTALATFAIAWFTLTLYEATKLQARITGDALKLAQDEFNATYRPKLRIRRIGNVVMQPGKAATARIMVANIGTSEAKIFAIGVNMYPRKTETVTNVDADPKFFGPEIIPAGKQAIIDVTGGTLLSINDISGITHDTAQLCVVGVLNYSSTATEPVLMNLGFFRIYRSQKGRFYPAAPDDPDADRDYED
jgi:hypothetical protein